MYFHSNTLKSFAKNEEEFILCLFSAVKGHLGRARDKIRKSIGTSTTMSLEKTIDIQADLRFVTASVKYYITTLDGESLMTYGEIMMVAKESLCVYTLSYYNAFYKNIGIEMAIF